MLSENGKEEVAQLAAGKPVVGIGAAVVPTAVEACAEVATANSVVAGASVVAGTSVVDRAVVAGASVVDDMLVAGAPGAVVAV